MSFYGKDPQPETTPRMRHFSYRLDGDDKPRQIEAQDVYFYESGHIGFWNDTDDDDRVLVLAVKALEVREEPA